MEMTKLWEVVYALLAGAVCYLLGWAFSRYLTRRGIRLDQPRKFPHEEEKVVVCLDFYSEKDGWHVTFNKGFGVCYGIIANYYNRKAKVGTEFEAVILSTPEEPANEGFYFLAI